MFSHHLKIQESIAGLLELCVQVLNIQDVIMQIYNIYYLIF